MELVLINTGSWYTNITTTRLGHDRSQPCPHVDTAKHWHGALHKASTWGKFTNTKPQGSAEGYAIRPNIIWGKERKGLGALWPVVLLLEAEPWDSPRIQRLAWTAVVKNLKPQLPGAAGLRRGPLLPFVLLHQSSHTPVWILNLLVHAAVPKVRGHQQRTRCQFFRSTQGLTGGHSCEHYRGKRQEGKASASKTLVT